MPLIGMFTNLKATDPEKVMRRNAFLIGLQAEVASSPNLKKIRFLSRHADRGALEGPDPMSPDQEYKDKAAQLANKHADVYVASCWPTMNALITATGTNDKIVIAGMFDPKPPTGYYGPKVYGFLSFDLSIADAWIKRLKSFTKAGGAAINKVGVWLGRPGPRMAPTPYTTMISIRGRGSWPIRPWRHLFKTGSGWENPAAAAIASYVIGTGGRSRACCK